MGLAPTVGSAAGVSAFLLLLLRAPAGRPGERLGSHKTINVGLRDQLGAFVQLGAEPAHDDGAIGKFALLNGFEHAAAAPGALFRLANAVAMAGFLHIGATLFSSDSPGSHGSVPLQTFVRLHRKENRIAKEAENGKRANRHQSAACGQSVAVASSAPSGEDT